ncbi:MAG: YgeY family selenium metabolism-linked hydrolase, partial [Phycisphaerae bacterium]|nr:YgeY family selenium metabolism-linked hydrolase [Phycisphaerae bacterium]
MDSRRIVSRAEHYRGSMVRFLRDLIAIPSESTQEKRVIQRIAAEMRSTKAFDRVWTDGFGNLFGQVGKGPRAIAIDAHVDT